MSLIRQFLDNVVKYWVLLTATVLIVFYLGGFVIQVSQIQAEQASLRVRIVELEQRQSKIEDKVNIQNIEVLTRLSRMEAILEEIRKR
jgi:uncharacterized membrane protein YqhA